MLVLNADDFGISKGASLGILKLVNAERLSAFSVMVHTNTAADFASDVRDARESAAVGLHLNLTEGQTLTNFSDFGKQGIFPSLSTLIKRCLLKSINVDQLRAEIKKQFDVFEDIVQSPPDHIDGHQHVQVLPVVRDIVVEEVKRRYSSNTPLLRNSISKHSLAFKDGLNCGVKAHVVKNVGYGYLPLLQKHNIPFNTEFAGFSEFNVNIDFETELNRWVVPTNALRIIMCHPGVEYKSEIEVDLLSHRRPHEMKALEQYESLSRFIWHPSRETSSAMVQWFESSNAAS